MATEQRIKVRMVSEENTGTFYTTHVKKGATKLRLRKYDPKLGRHAWFKQEKMK